MIKCGKFELQKILNSVSAALATRRSHVDSELACCQALRAKTGVSQEGLSFDTFIERNACVT